MAGPATRKAAGLCLALLAVFACTRTDLPPPPPPPPPPPVDATTALRPVPPDELPSFVDDGDRAGLIAAARRSRDWLRGRPEGSELRFGPRVVGAVDLAAGLERWLELLAAEPTAEELAAAVAEHFEVFESVGGDDGEMLVTGYYEPVIDGSRRRDAEHRVPVYALPPDLVTADLGLFSEDLLGKRIAGRLDGRKLVPYPDRAELRTGSHLRGRELAWARDRVDLFFIEVQGSGALRMADGSEMRIGYAGANGHPYRSIGRLLIDEGKVAREAMSMQAIRAYLAAHPHEIERVLDYNPSVVFFRRLEGPPLGNLGLPVTAERSIATDHRLMPRGALGFLVTDVPSEDPAVAPSELRRFVLNQDTGGAIRGAGRVDLFWGRGADAARNAGLMKQPGRLFFFLPKAPLEEAS